LPEFLAEQPYYSLEQASVWAREGGDQREKKKAVIKIGNLLHLLMIK